MHLFASAQGDCTVSFSGVVLSDQGGILEGASVEIGTLKLGTVTNDQGKFMFTGLCPGVYDVVIQYVGFESKTISVKLLQNITWTVRLSQGTTQLNEVVIRDKQVVTENAQNFSVLSEKQLRETSGKALGEALKEIPGVNAIQSGPGIFKPVIHGLHSQRILILNYGIRQEGQQWGAEHAPEIDPFVASNVVVIKDASAIKYGTDALGGVIVVNPSPLPDAEGIGGSVNTVFQSNGRSGTISGLLEGGLKNHSGWGWRMQGTLKRTGDFHTPDYMLTNTGVRENNFSVATGYHDEHKGLDIFFSHFQTEVGVLKGTSVSNLDDLVNAMEREPPQYTDDFSYSIGEPRQEVSHNLLKINGHIQTNLGEVSLQYGFQNNNRKEFDIRIGGLSETPSIDLRLNTHTVEADWESTIFNRHTMCVGLTGMFQDNNNIAGTQRIPFIPNFNNISSGIFGVSKLQFGQVALDVGARYDYRYYHVRGYDFRNTLYKSDLQFHNLSATAGMTAMLDKNEVLTFNLSSAWRPPHVAELYSLGTHQSAAAIEYGLLLNDSTNEVMNINDVPFETEQAVKAVGGYQRTWKNVSFDGSIYANYIFNYIYLRPTGVTQNVRGTYPYFRYTQTDALYIGADLSATWEIDRHWKVSPKVSLIQARDIGNGDYLVFIPSNRSELALRYETTKIFTFKNFFAESKVKWVAAQTRVPRTITVKEFRDAIEKNTDPFHGSSANFDFMDAPDSYWLLNFAIGLTLETEKTKLDFRLASENTLNTIYREYTNRFRYYANDLGRNILLSIKCTF